MTKPVQRILVSFIATPSLLAACTHDVNVTKQTLGGPSYATIDERTKIAGSTCEAQYKKDRQNYLSAVQAIIASGRVLPNATNAPLDRFRAEVNAAYNAVVMRCKTHMHCLEFQGYNEAACYMAASDRKDAERRFSDLAEDLRRIEREHSVHKAHHKKKHGKGHGGKPSVNVTVTQKNDQSQTNDNHNGDRVEDQDVLVLCGDAKNLLDRRCRPQCGQSNC